MVSKWYELKPKAIKMRQAGISLRGVEKKLNIPRSTLSGWFKEIMLTDEQKTKLKKVHVEHLIEARKIAVKWHNTQKELRIKDAEDKALISLNQVKVNDLFIQELALAMLYLGEGGKTDSGTIMGSSDPLILKFFIKMLLNNYQVDINKIKCALHLRADQSPEKLKRYWSKQLNIPLKNFTLTSIDRRSEGEITYPQYNGVCVVSCGNIAIQRKLMHLARKFCEKISV